ncbi:metallophosphoesterase family protein [Lichenifustis flavocetrariae]|uniref:Metallophosphatase family protein n=1 Tax=Lichenifustis flavocetrariae TaxID=2949735 RepID=A0AA41Z1N6_9HYPH|nr:metallophosphoesterase family protein [Lichenifustis flavocetrariae]MCW6512084.1 metallophosphatase family protein [Lichenifustis flavocetrariae]
MSFGRIAVLADIHGNLPALEAVLAEVDAARVDVVVLNGDLADGPFPTGTLERLEALGDRAIWLRGNGDRWLAEARAGRYHHADVATDAMIQWAARAISEAQAERLGALPLSCTFAVAGLGTVGICHATGRNDDEMFLVDSSLDHALAAFAALEGDTVVLGHCHMPFDRLFNRRRFINAGSVGMPYGHMGASWLLLGAEVVLKRTPYDVERAIERMLVSGMPGVEDFVESYVKATPSDAEALTDYREILQRQQQAQDFG